MKLRCQKCKLEWDYQGNKKPNNNYNTYVACPRCRSSIKLLEEKDAKK